MNGPWSNNACLGYVIAALQRKGWSKEQIKEVVGAVYSEFDFKTVDEARRIYEKSIY
jgi:alkylhydroperoxidase/carboxymuconolactone decarboxylase family protein YurZ